MAFKSFCQDNGLLLLAGGHLGVRSGPIEAPKTFHILHFIISSWNFCVMWECPAVMLTFPNSWLCLHFKSNHFYLWHRDLYDTTRLKDRDHIGITFGAKTKSPGS
jgi:hypothetical protein